jgi:uncharacterized protein (DUF362 family)
LASKVAVLRTKPETVLEDYHRVMEMADAGRYLSAERDLLLKLNLSWTKYFPACSSQPWQLEGVLLDLFQRGYAREQLKPVENKTVVTNPRKGAVNNLWMPILEENGLPFIALPEIEWTVFKFKSDLLRLNEIFPEGIEIPRLFIGKDILHLPTVKTHGHSTTTGAVKNSFGGLLKEVRHYAHKYMHEVLVDLLLMQRELHPNIFAVMDGTVCGNGAGPRTMDPYEGDIILASGDSVAIDAVAATIMGFNPMEIGYLRMAAERGLGEASIDNIEVVGEDIEKLNFHFKMKRSFVIWGDQMLRRGPLRFLEKAALHSPLVFWAPLASNIYHDGIWYPTVGMSKIRAFGRTKWGHLWEHYRKRST